MKKAIGIEILEDSIRIVQMVRDRRCLLVEKAAVCPMRRSTDQPAEILSQIGTSAGLDVTSPVAVALAPQQVYYRPSPLWRIPPDAIPIPADQLVMASCVQQDRSMTVATARSSLEGLLKVAHWARIALIDAPAFAIWAALLANHPQAAKGRVVVCHLAGSYLTILCGQDGQLVYVRNTPWARDGAMTGLAGLIGATYQRAFGGPVQQDAVVYLGSWAVDRSSVTRAIELELGLRTVQIDLAARVVWEKASPRPELLVAEGLALRLLVPTARGVNLIAADRQDHRVQIRKEIQLCGVLVMLVMLGILAGLLLQRASLRSDHARITQRIQSVLDLGLADRVAWAKTGPFALRLVDQRLHDQTLLMDWQQGRLGPLVVLEQIARSRHGLAGIVVQRIRIDRDGLSIYCRCPSSSQLDQWKQRLHVLPGLGRLRVDPVGDADAAGFVIQAAYNEDGHDGKT